MEGIFKAGFEFLGELLKTQGAFVTVIFLIVMGQSFVLWAVFVSHTNKSIALKRKEISMNEVDQCILTIYNRMMDHYGVLAADVLGGDYFNTQEYALYRYQAMQALDEKKPVYRTRVRKNGYDKKTPEQWRRYVQGCIEEDTEALSLYLDTHYHPTAIIKRPALHLHNMTIVPAICKDLENLFAELLEISNNNKYKKFFGFPLEIGKVA